MYKFILLICFLSFSSPCFAWWQYKANQDKMTDEITSAVAWTVNHRSQVSFGVGCRPDPNPEYSSLYVLYGWQAAKYHWATEVTKKDRYFPLRVDYRIDKNLPIETYWHLDTGQSFPIIKKTISPKDSLLIGLIRGQNVTFRVSDPTGKSQDVTFSLSGSGKQIYKVINACK